MRRPGGLGPYTYRREFERAIGAQLTGQFAPDAWGEVLKLVPEPARPFVQAMGEDCTVVHVLASVTLTKALAGEERALTEVLTRVWPAVQRHEVVEVDSFAGRLRRASEARERSHGVPLTTTQSMGEPHHVTL